LRKEGSLTTEEYHEIQTHARGTFTLLSKFKFKNGLVDGARPSPPANHERFDGNGYPRALKGENIPLWARVLAVADGLDAINLKRHYRRRDVGADALAIMKREAGGHFDRGVHHGAVLKSPAGNFVKIHMAEHLNKLDAVDLVSPGITDVGRIAADLRPRPRRPANQWNGCEYFTSTTKARYR